MNAPTTTEPTQPTPPATSGQPPYISPTLAKLEAKHRPNPSPACETCPASVWFTTSDQLKCYCTRMHLIVWDQNEAPILSCDGRELALLALMPPQA